MKSTPVTEFTKILSKMNDQSYFRKKTLSKFYIFYKKVKIYDFYVITLQLGFGVRTKKNLSKSFIFKFLIILV
jgi:hypothetical protein